MTKELTTKADFFFPPDSPFDSKGDIKYTKPCSRSFKINATELNYHSQPSLARRVENISFFIYLLSKKSISLSFL